MSFFGCRRILWLLSTGASTPRLPTIFFKGTLLLISRCDCGVPGQSYCLHVTWLQPNLGAVNLLMSKITQHVHDVRECQSIDGDVIRCPPVWKVI